MEKRAVDLQQMTLINELTHAKELASQLKNHIDPKAPPDACDILLKKILSSCDKVLSMLNQSPSLAEPLLPAAILDSPHSAAGASPRSKGSDLDSKDQVHNDVVKKSKTMPRWSEQVQVGSETKSEGPLNDGYSWRKYGQKDILGANFPRAYYRCTYRNEQGCLATKKVQKSDNDPSIFEVTYGGRHTCIQTPRSHGKKMPKQKIQREEKEDEGSEQSPDTPSNFIFEAGHLGNIPGEIYPPFSFPSTSMQSENVEKMFFQTNFLDAYSPYLVSQSPSPGEFSDFVTGHNLPCSNSTSTSTANSPMEDFDFLLEQEAIDPNFPIDQL